MTTTVVPATLQHVEKALEIGIGVSVRLLDRIADAGLRGEMHHAGKPMPRKQRRNRLAIGKIGLHEGEAAIGPQELQACPFQRRIVIAVEIVESDNGPALGQELPGDLKADEAGGTRDQNRL